MSTEVEKLEHRLYGNGQPGDIGKLDTRVKTLEDFKVKAILICCIVAFASGGGDVSLTALRHWLLGQ